MEKRLFLGPEGRLAQTQLSGGGGITYQAHAAPIMQRGNDAGKILFDFPFVEKTTILGA